jgi:hypothetical protein
VVSQRETEIKELAYTFWEQEGRIHGKDIDHWLRAEAEIDLVRINELRSLIRNPPVPEHAFYFLNFEGIGERSPKRRQFLDIEHDLQGLPGKAWERLKKDIAPLLPIKDPTRGWQAIFDKLNHAKAYNHLARRGCACIQFIPESNDKRTPDLKATQYGAEILCEVKTINTSEIEVQRRVKGGVGTIEADLSAGFLRKLTHDIENATQQLNACSTEGTAQKIVYIIVNFDDSFHEYKDMYENQIARFLNTTSLSG